MENKENNALKTVQIKLLMKLMIFFRHHKWTNWSQMNRLFDQKYCHRRNWRLFLKSCSSKKPSIEMVLWVNSFKSLKNRFFLVLSLLGSIGKGWRLLNSFCEATLTLIFKPDRKHKIKLQTKLAYEYWWKILNKILANRIRQHIKRVWRWQSKHKLSSSLAEPGP